MAECIVTNIKWLRDNGWLISSDYQDSYCPNYKQLTIHDQIPISGISNVTVDEICEATSENYTNNQLVCQVDIHMLTCSCDSFTASTASVTFDSSGSTSTVGSIVSDCSITKGTGTPSWITVSSTSGVVKLTATSNNTGSERTGTVTLNVGGDCASKQISVKQPSGEGCNCSSLSTDYDIIRWSYNEVTGKTPKDVTVTIDSTCISAKPTPTIEEGGNCTVSAIGSNNKFTITPTGTIGAANISLSYNSGTESCKKYVSCYFDDADCDCTEVTTSTDKLQWTYGEVSGGQPKTLNVTIPSCFTATTVEVLDSSYCTATINSGVLTITPKGVTGKTAVNIINKAGQTISCKKTIECEFLACSTKVDDIYLKQVTRNTDGTETITLQQEQFIDVNKKYPLTDTQIAYLYADGTTSYTVSLCDAPIAVRLIPASHTSDGKARWISIKNMSTSSTSGTINDEVISRPSASAISSLSIKNDRIDAEDVINANGGRILYNGRYGSLEQTDSHGVQLAENGLWYISNDNNIKSGNAEYAMISPFNSNYTKNDKFYDYSLGTLTGDYGKSNTLAMKNLGSIAVANAVSNFAPGFKDNQWYLPSYYEANYYHALFKKLNEAIEAANAVHPNCGALFKANGGYVLAYRYAINYSLTSMHFNGRQDEKGQPVPASPNDIVRAILDY